MPSTEEEIKEMQREAQKMAAFFVKHIKTEDLVCWLLNANQDLFYSIECNERTEAGEAEAGDFLNTFSWSLLPNLMRCKSDKERLQVLEKELPDLLKATMYENIKKALYRVGLAFLASYSKLTHGTDQVLKFMKMLGSIMALTEMYVEYEALYFKEYKEQGSEKVA